MVIMVMALCTLPLEILDCIAFELSAITPLGPPSSLLSFLLTCHHIHHYLSSETNPGLYARIFKYKFDTSAVERRAFRPGHRQCVDQFKHYCRAMKVLRRGDVYACPGRRGGGWDEEVYGDDNDAGDAMFTAFMMMLEDDGRNYRQLVEWGRADVFVEQHVCKRLYEGRERNEGWPVESVENACAVWLMWMFTTQEKLENEEQTVRETIISLVLPFVLVPYRYTTSEAPPNHFHLPLSLSPTHSLPHSIQTPHGPYPIYPPPRSTSQIHFSTRPLFSPPLISPAAKLLYFSRREIVKFPIPPHLARDRDEAHARGNFEVGPTREDVHEANWGWTARLPGGEGGSKAWLWGVGDFIALPSPSPPITTPAPTPTPTPTDPPPRWSGKAPHTPHTHTLPKSKRWDTDWWRLRLCGNSSRPRTRIPYGKVYEPGCMDGLWQGRMLTPAEAGIQNLLGNPLFPPLEEFNEGALNVMTRPIFLRMTEVHGVYGDSTCVHEHGHEHGASECQCERGSAGVGVGVGGDDGMSNAWFPGEPGTVEMRTISDGDTRTRSSNRGMGKKVAVSVARAQTQTRAFYRAWERPSSSSSSSHSNQHAYEDISTEWKGYPHPVDTCPVCMEREALMGSLRREEREGREEGEERDGGRGRVLEGDERVLEGDERVLDGDGDREEQGAMERVFADVGLGLGAGASRQEGSSADPSSSSSSDEEDSDSDPDPDSDSEDSSEWDMKLETEPSLDTLGRLYPPAPPAHDKRKLTSGVCDGIREVLLFGETDERHGEAWNHYTFYGRVRAWDGLIGILRKPRNPAFGYIFFYGYIVGGENFVGNWRITSADPVAPVWESAFAMSRRDDA